ncbi:uncharacterized protein EV422DRAFT_566477 [Fimicolochytrium jonesii]|uniref:uncharacterized protein n=1 Tax=Fimicolochytrium jonesii TaxID=1396493 RepID=UPI0022FE73CC|nr:uncharacterized protein EV422DRAFT_566477 [Fimicolochytrium jonesii]KAI8822053.1 hypothetical protein EV422DRAFT_566477 [Fimicolochytrium jonesii]
MATSSEEVIRFIIREIVNRSTNVLKARRNVAESNVPAAGAGESGTPTAVRPSLSGDAAIISETLAAFMVRAVVLDPRYDFRIERELGRDEVDRLIKCCVDKITLTNDPVMETVKMQVYFDTNFPAQADFLHKEKQSRISACAVLLREIVEVRTKAIPVYEALYRKIVSYLLLRSHVGNPTDMRVVREATAGLESVFPQSELSAFISLSRQEKEAQLNGLAQLVTGIRLFNKQLGKGGEGVDDLPHLCTRELNHLSTTLKQLTTTTEDQIQLYTAVADYADVSPNPQLEDVSLPRLRSALVFKREFLIYLDALHEQTNRSRTTLETLTARFEEAVKELKVTCRAKTAVPVDQVYPPFILLANLWQNYMDELFLLAFRRGIVDTIQQHAKGFEFNIPNMLVTFSQPFRKEIESAILPESQVIAKASELMVSLAVKGTKGIEIIHPGNATQYYQLPVEYGGFCPHTLIRREGLVVPGDKNYGLVKYRDKLYALANDNAIKEFAKLPELYIEGVLEMARRSADLVQMLHLYPYFPTIEALENAKSFTRQRLLGQVPLVTEQGTQVDTHIVDTYIDPNYEWNEWTLRRRALMLVNLRTKATHSTQTQRSHFRRSNETQHYAPKPAEAQTMRVSGAAATPRKSTFLGGLRYAPRDPATGDTAPRFKVCDLTLDWDGMPAPYGGGAFGVRMSPDKAAAAGAGRVVQARGEKREVNPG